MRNGFLWSDLVFRERSNFPQIWFRDIKFRTWLLSRNFDNQLSSNFRRFVILCICWDTPSKKTGLWQLPIVSSVFKGKYFFIENYNLMFAKLTKWKTGTLLAFRYKYIFKSEWPNQKIILSDHDFLGDSFSDQNDQTTRSLLRINNIIL